MENKSFLDRFIERIDKIDSNSLQAYILHLSRERGFFETVFNAVQEGILVVDRHLRIQYHNQAAQELLALPEDLKRVRLSQLLPMIDWKRVLLLDAGEWVRLSRQEIEIAYPEHRTLQFYLMPSEETQGFATVILRDVTETRRRTEEEMESARSQVVEMLSAGVAHEIGNPLNSLYLNLQLLTRLFADNVPEDARPDRAECREMIEACTAEVERLDTIIRQFLQAFRAGAGNPVDTSLVEIVEDTLRFMAREFEDRNISVRLHFVENMPPIVGDQGQLKQAFYNILRNAMQAMPSGGALEVTGTFDADNVRLEFSDSGCGIRPEVLNRMFEPFKSFRTNGGGTGIGMMIIDRILRAHGAKLDVESVPGRGTTLLVSFPRHGERLQMLPCADNIREEIGEEESEEDQNILDVLPREPRSETPGEKQ